MGRTTPKTKGTAGNLPCGVYARISLDQAGEGLGVSRQVQKCKAKAQALGWTVLDTYEDNDVSATADTPRPAYDRLLADLESGRIRAVVVYAIDRLTRRPIELEAFISLTERLGVALANVSGDVRLDTLEGRLTARIMGSVARAEAERLGKRVHDQKRQRAERGIPHKGRHRLYGYTGRVKQSDGTYVGTDWEIVPDEAAIIKEVFQRRAAGESTTAIAKDLTDRGITTVSGNPWKSGTLSETLTKVVYMGKVSFKGEIIADSIYPAIVDEDTFNAAQTNLANDSKGTNARRYLLSGFLRCAYCTTQFKGNPANQMYRCSSTYGGCGRLSVRITKADEWIKHAAMEHAASQPRKTGPVRDYDAEAQGIRDAIQGLQADYRAGIYTMDEATPLIKEQRERLAAVAKAKAKAKPIRNPVLARYFDWQAMNLSQRRAFLDEHIKYVVVGPAVSRGNQPFNPARFEVHYTDDTVEVLSGALPEEDL